MSLRMIRTTTLPVTLQAMNLQVIGLGTTGKLNSCEVNHGLHVVNTNLLNLGVNVATVYQCQHQWSVFVVKKLLL